MYSINQPEDLLIGLALLLTASATVEDLFRNKISNPLIAVFFMVGFFIKFSASGLEAGLSGLLHGFLVLGALFPLFLLRALGAGDVKLFATLSFMVGIQLMGHVLLYSLFIAGFIGALALSFSFIRRRRGQPAQASLVSSEELQGMRQANRHYLPYAPAIFMGALLTFSSDRPESLARLFANG